MALKTKNQFRESKMKEAQKIYDLYPDLLVHERLFMILDEFSRNAIRKEDHTQLASLNELAVLFDGIFINAKTGKPTADALNWTSRLVTKIRKDKGHPHIRPYTQPYVEVLADGTEAVRNYLDFLRGSKAVYVVNNRLEGQRTGIRQAQKLNEELLNTKRVMREVEHYRIQLQIKQDEANRKRHKKERK